MNLVVKEYVAAQDANDPGFSFSRGSPVLPPNVGMPCWLIPTTWN